VLFSRKIPSYVAARLTARYWAPYLLRFATNLPLVATVRHYSRLCATIRTIRDYSYYSLFAIRYSLFAIRYSGFSDTPLFPYHLQRAEIFAVRRSTIRWKWMSSWENFSRHALRVVFNGFSGPIGQCKTQTAYCSLRFTLTVDRYYVFLLLSSFDCDQNPGGGGGYVRFQRVCFFQPFWS